MLSFILCCYWADWTGHPPLCRQVGGFSRWRGIHRLLRLLTWPGWFRSASLNWKWQQKHQRENKPILSWLVINSQLQDRLCSSSQRINAVNFTRNPKIIKCADGRNECVQSWNMLIKWQEGQDKCWPFKKPQKLFKIPKMKRDVQMFCSGPNTSSHFLPAFKSFCHKYHQQLEHEVTKEM